jgi:hypothetical protein
MSLARGPLFEAARSRLQEGPAREASTVIAARASERDSNLQTDLEAERARARSISLARQRERFRALRQEPTATGATLGPNPGAAERALPSGWAQSNELLIRRAQMQMRGGYSGREVGVRTAGLAMSPDGRTLWCACEDGIFEVDMDLKGRMFWPAIEMR